jgi:hypothetical protein
VFNAPHDEIEWGDYSINPKEGFDAAVSTANTANKNISMNISYGQEKEHIQLV